MEDNTAQGRNTIRVGNVSIAFDKFTIVALAVLILIFLGLFAIHEPFRRATTCIATGGLECNEPMSNTQFEVDLSQEIEGLRRAVDAATSAYGR